MSKKYMITYDESLKRGRPAAVNKNTLPMLDYAFSIGCSDVEACAYANISTSAFYNYIRKHPDYRERKEALKKYPVLKAKEGSRKLIEEGDPVHLRWFLEHKCREEYGNRAEIDINAGGCLTIEERREALGDFLKRFTCGAGEE